MNGDTNPAVYGWIRLYNLTFFVALSIGAAVFFTLSTISPLTGLHEEAGFIVDGIAGSEDENKEDML